MNKVINWDETIKNWKPSEGDCELIPKDSQEITGVASVMQSCFQDEKDSVVEFMGKRAKQAALTDSVSKWLLLEVASTQLLQHKTAWKTHLQKDSKTDNLTVEFPVAIPSLPHLKYFKIFIQDGKKKLTNPKTVKQVLLDYHNGKESVEIKYV